MPDVRLLTISDYIRRIVSIRGGKMVAVVRDSHDSFVDQVCCKCVFTRAEFNKRAPPRGIEKLRPALQAASTLNRIE